MYGFINWQYSIIHFRQEEDRMRVFESIGDMLLKVADYIYSMTSSMLGGEEIPPKELKEKSRKDTLEQWGTIWKRLKG